MIHFIEEIVQALFECGALERNGGVSLVRPLVEIQVSSPRAVPL
jgi:hypothetical protein